MAIAFVSAAAHGVSPAATTNTAVIDPNFSNRIVRIINAATNPNFPNTSYETRSSGSGDENIFNTDSTLFSLQAGRTTSGGPVYSFDLTNQGRVDEPVPCETRVTSACVLGE